MDYLFIPGQGTAESRARDVIPHRPNTRLITPTRASGPSIEGFLKLLRKPATRPFGDLIFVAHGHYFGAYELAIDKKHGSPTQFEDAADADLSDSVRLLTEDLEQPDGSTATITVRLRGCNVGVAKPFIEKFQKAMTRTGGTLNLTVPLHFDEFSPVTGGYVEYLAHSFRVTSPTPFKDQAALIAAFDQHVPKFTFIGGQTVPLDLWKAWIPTAIHPSSDQKFDHHVSVSPAIGTVKDAKLNREYRYKAIPFTWEWGAPDPGTHAEQIKILRDTLPQGTDHAGNRTYDPSYDYPIYIRYGFKDLDDYVNTLNWKVTKSGTKLKFRAERHEYTLLIPIADPPAPPATKPTLKFYNFYPSSGTSGFVSTLNESNALLFLSL